MTPPPAKPATIAVLLGSLAGLAPFALDTYLPGFPEIAISLGATRATVQQSLTSYLAPYAAMMLVHGPLSDRYGRRPAIAVALLIFCLGSLGCATAQSIEAFLAFRMLQGLSVGATTVVGRALIRDLFEGASAQRQFALVNLVFTLAPAVAPILGGYLLTTAGWRSIFWFLLLYPLALLTVCWRWLPETLPRERRVPLHLIRVVSNLLSLVERPAFGALVLMTAASFCGFFGYILAAPAFVRDLLGLEPTEFAWLFLATACGTLLGSYWATRRAETRAPAATIALGLARRSSSGSESRLSLGARTGAALERSPTHAVLLRLRAHAAERDSAHPRHLAAAARSDVILAGVRPDRLRDAQLRARCPIRDALGVLACGSDARMVVGVGHMLGRGTPRVDCIPSLNSLPLVCRGIPPDMSMDI